MPGSIPLFKSELQQDYLRFRSLMQVTDLLTLDLDTFKFDKRALIAAVIYVQLGVFWNIFPRESISACQNV